MIVIGMLALFTGSGCTLVDPQLKGDSAGVAAPPVGTRAAPVRFGVLEGRLRHGAEIGRYTWGLLCKPPYRSITWETGRRLVSNRDYRDLFHDALTHLGYDVAGDPSRLYDLEEDEARAELLISGQVDEIALDLCRRYSWWYGGFTGYTGAGLIRVLWTVYDPLRRRVVYQTTSTGFGQEDVTHPDAREIILERAFTDAAAALGLDDGFRRLVFQPLGRTGTPGPVPPGPTPLTVPRPAEPRPDPDYPPGPGPVSAFPDPGDRPRGGTRQARQPWEYQEPGLRVSGDRLAAESDHPALGAVPEMDIPRRRRRAGPIAANAPDLVRATVVISTAVALGSGFFIATDPAGGGWILTSARVVGDAGRVRITTSNRRAAIGTVVRRHRARDAALIHVEGEVPAVVSIRESPVTVGEEVFAMGAPLGRAYRDTLSHGVVSRFARIPGTRQPVIQSDVMTRHGSSCGPLTDASGNVVGFCVGGEPSPADRSEGIEWFIPIADAFDKLKLVLSGKA
ncbi:MAG: S1C family serine protease [Rhodospirillaceae bacterium]